MEANYAELRRRVGVDRFDQATDSDREVERDFRILRPDANYKLDDVLRGRVKDTERRLPRRKLPPEVKFMREKRLEAGLPIAPKVPQTARDVAAQNKRERMFRRSGFFNPPPPASRVVAATGPPEDLNSSRNATTETSMAGDASL